MEPSYKHLLNDIRAFVFDVDGVMTDGSLYLMEGEQYRVMNIRDGYAIVEAIKAGYHVMVISGGDSDSVRERLNGLGVREVHLGISDKSAMFNELLSKHGLQTKEVMYMGDDLPDYRVIQLAGMKVCPSDAIPEIKRLCHYVSPYTGGKGCVRDVIEQVMRVHGRWPFQSEHR